jgi:hypothetical protein
MAAEDFEDGARQGYTHRVRVSRRGHNQSGYVTPAVGSREYAPHLTPHQGSALQIHIGKDDDTFEVFSADMRGLDAADMSAVVNAAYAEAGPGADIYDRGEIAMRALAQAVRDRPSLGAAPTLPTQAPAAPPAPRSPVVNGKLMTDILNKPPRPTPRPSSKPVPPRRVLIELPNDGGQIQCVYADVARTDDCLILVHDNAASTGYVWVPPKPATNVDAPEMAVLVYDEDGHMDSAYAVKPTRQSFHYQNLQFFLFTIVGEKNYREGPDDDAGGPVGPDGGGDG